MQQAPGSALQVCTSSKQPTANAIFTSHQPQIPPSKKESLLA